MGTHFVRLELLIPNMYFIPGFIERRAEFRARKWNLKQKWHFLGPKSSEMKNNIDVGSHSVRLEMLIPNMWFITWFRERRAEFRAWKWNLKEKWHFLGPKSLEMKNNIDVGSHSVRLEMLIPNMYFITRRYRTPCTPLRRAAPIWFSFALTFWQPN